MKVSKPDFFFFFFKSPNIKETTNQIYIHLIFSSLCCAAYFLPSVWQNSDCVQSSLHRVLSMLLRLGWTGSNRTLIPLHTSDTSQTLQFIRTWIHELFIAATWNNLRHTAAAGASRLSNTNNSDGSASSAWQGGDTDNSAGRFKEQLKWSPHMEGMAAIEPVRSWRHQGGWEKEGGDINLPSACGKRMHPTRLIQRLQQTPEEHKTTIWHSIYY